MNTTAFSWQTLRTIIGGDSALDLPKVDITTRTRAEAFLTAYGFDWSDPAQRAEVAEVHSDGLYYLERHLLEPGEAVLPEVRAETDPRQLIVWAGARDGGPRQRWACALLRVMHTRAHMVSPLLDAHGDEIRRQILGRLQAHVRVTPTGMQLGTDEAAVPLVDFTIKTEKAWTSVLTKLLHKPGNVAATVFDFIGVRFVTESRLDALRVIYFLRVRDVVMFTHVMPTRSHNSLVDLDRLEPRMKALDAALLSGALSEVRHMEVLQDLAEGLGPALDEPCHNPFSDQTWRSIQFTGRQLIRVPGASGAARRFFFPFEVQVVDRASRDAARAGAGSHAAYKVRQRAEVRRRVLGSLVGAH